VHLDLARDRALGAQQGDGLGPALAMVMKPTPFIPAMAGRVQGALMVRAPIL
jgi:hypothetical protein